MSVVYVGAVVISLEAGKLYECSLNLGLRALDKKEHIYGLMVAYIPFVFLENLSWEAHLAGMGIKMGMKLRCMKNVRTMSFLW
jgi:hypothetical protein